MVFWSKLVTQSVFGNSLWSCMRPISEAKKWPPTAWNYLCELREESFNGMKKAIAYANCYFGWSSLIFNRRLFWREYVLGSYFPYFQWTTKCFDSAKKSLFMVSRPICKESLTFLRKIATQLIVKKAIHFADYCIL